MGLGILNGSISVLIVVLCHSAGAEKGDLLQYSARFTEETTGAPEVKK